MNDTFYRICDFIIFGTTIIALIVSIRYGNSKKYLFPIQLYIIFSLFNGLFLNILEQLPQKNIYYNVANAEINIYSIVEFSIFYYFIHKNIHGKRNKNFLLFLYILYTSFIFFTWLRIHNGIFSSLPSHYGLGNLFITIASLFYIYEILKSDLINDFKTNAKFLVTCGALFYFSTTIPIFFLTNVLYALAPTFITLYNGINELLFSILFISFIKAYLCPSPQQK
jgi:hypothetical protein